MTIISGRSIHLLKYRRTFGARHGAGVWDSIKNFARKLFGSKSVQSVIRHGAQQILHHAPKGIQWGLDKLGKRLPPTITKTLGDLALKGIEAGKQHLSRDADAYGGIAKHHPTNREAIKVAEKSEVGSGVRKPPTKAGDPYKRSKELLAGLLGKR